MNQDLENEIQEAMTETVQTEDNLDGKLFIFSLKKKIIYVILVLLFLLGFGFIFHLFLLDLNYLVFCL